jgi:uncharacterized protein YceK
MKPSFFVLLLIGVLAGCGTTGNLLHDRPAYFGGVADDWDAFKAYSEHDSQSLVSDLFWSSFLAADLPLSLTGDTLTLPYIWVQSLFNTGHSPDSFSGLP